ncbi:MAG: sigma-70 family RNA polymerase sigma factor [Bacteroidota bacterium]
MTEKGFAENGRNGARASGQAGVNGRGFSRDEERKLLLEAREGDPRALRRLLERLSPPIYRFGRSFCRDSDDAEDVMQEVLVSLVRSIPTIRGGSSLTTWAYTVARRACHRQRRRAGRAGPAAPAPELPEPESPAPDPGAEMERRELETALRDAIRTLPPAYREAVVLRDLEGLPAREAARILGVSERALKSRLHRARIALRDRLAPRFGSRPEAAHRPGCAEAGRLLNRYLDGELDRRACAAMQVHVDACPSCGAACRALRDALAFCKRPGARRLPPGARESLRRAIRGALDEIAATA